jgi:DNA-binding transcriptional ArsR family regulator
MAGRRTEPAGIDNGDDDDISTHAEPLWWHPSDMPWAAASPIAPIANGHVAGDADVARVAGLVGDPTRAAMLVALLDGRPRTAGELGRLGRVAPSTASGHLARLLEGGLVTCEPVGRQRRYRLASPEAAELLETLARLAPAARPQSLRGADRAQALRSARLCYDHLAGVLGVAVTESLVVRGALELAADGSAFALTGRGERELADLGVDVPAARARRRSFARACLDWSERRPHLAGALGAGVADAFLRHGWIARRPDDRALVVTDAGRAALVRELAVRFD